MSCFFVSQCILGISVLKDLLSNRACHIKSRSKAIINCFKSINSRTLLVILILIKSVKLSRKIGFITLANKYNAFDWFLSRDF